MALGSPGRRNEPIYVIPMAFALALAAALGGVAGLVWHKVFGAEAEEAAAPAKAE